MHKLMGQLFFQSTGYLRRADKEHLESIFDRYASTEVNGVKYMTEVDFLVKYLGLFPEENFNKNSAKLLCGALDQSKDG